MPASIRVAAPTSGRRGQLLLLSLAVAAALCVAMQAGAQVHPPDREPIHDHGTLAPPPPGEPATLPPGARMMLHMEMTPLTNGSHGDSVRAASIATALRQALLPFRDTTAAVAAGYRMFAPRLKNQKIYHFTSSWRGIQEAVRFEPTRPTSLLYKKGPDGTFTLLGAMYTAPKRFTYDKLNARVPLSIARWHKHVNWCIPKRGATQRWLERRNDEPLFGPESPIYTKAECDAVGGEFHPTLFGWMVHANVFAGDDPATVWGGEHAGHDMQEGMTMDATHKMP